MKKLKKGFVTIILSSMLFNQSAVYAQYNSDEIVEEQVYDEDVIIAGSYLSSILQFIKDNYIGSDVSMEDIIESSIWGMTMPLDDYSEYFTAEEYDEFLKQLDSNIYGVGFVLQKDSDNYPNIIEVLQNTPAQKYGFKVDDYIIEIDGEDVKDKELDDISESITGNKSEEIEFTVLRDNEEINISVNTDIIDIQTVFSATIDEVVETDKKIDNSKIGYIYITSISDDTASEFKREFKKLRDNNVNKLVLDLRGNSGGVVQEAIDICKMIVPEGTIISVKDINGDIQEEKSNLKINPFKKIVVLVDSMTASAAEIIASALQDSGSMVVGSKTYGKGVMQSVVELPEMGYLKLTTHEYFSRDGRSINHIGITPNVIVDNVTLIKLTDDIESEIVKNAFSYLGYNVGNKRIMLTSLLKFQKDFELELTNELDFETIMAINIEIYKKTVEDDRILKAGYKEIIKD